MLDIGLQEMLLIGVIALLVFGPSKLPELGRMLGRAMREFRRVSDEFRSTVETNLQLNEPEPIPPMTSRTDSIAEPTPSALAATLPSEQEPIVDAETATARPPESAEPLCAQRGSRLFHRRECGWVARIAEPERVYFKVVADARDQGFANCPVCDPWEPA
jgi:sec-independent protein translocase protein TatB